MCELTAGSAGDDGGVVSFFGRPRLRTGSDLSGIAPTAPFRRAATTAAAEAARIDALDFDGERCGVFELDGWPRFTSPFFLRRLLWRVGEEAR